jgi:hypothetical protein
MGLTGITEELFLATIIKQYLGSLSVAIRLWNVFDVEAVFEVGQSLAEERHCRDNRLLPPFRAGT